MIDTATGAPADYAELFVHYTEMVQRAVSKCGVPAQEVEDVSMEVLCQFMEKDGLAAYNPLRVVDTLSGGRQRIPGPRHRTVKFGSYLWSFTSIYCLNHRDKIVRRARREGLWLDAPLTADGKTYAHMLEDDSPTTEKWVTDVETYGKVLQFAAPTMVTTGTHRWNMAEAFTACAESVATHGRIKRSEVAQTLGVSEALVSVILGKMQEILTEAGARTALGA